MTFYPGYPEFPNKDWELIQNFGLGYALRTKTGLRLIIDISEKVDKKEWMHVSISRKDRLPTWDELKKAKNDFIGRDHVAILVFPEEKDYVNLHPNCLHLWHCINGETCTNFTGEILGIKSI